MKREPRCTALQPLFCPAILAVIAAIFSSAARAADKPNIILILTDDVGLGDIHSFGGPFNTPNIDKLAAGGTKFTYCYATPLCGPSRCQLLTGRYPFRTGLNSNNSHTAVDPKTEVMIPTVMKKAGYVTGSVGKWGQIQLGPGEWGFDEYFVFPGSGRYWSEQSPYYTVNGKRQELKEGEYLPDLMHKFAVDFIDQHKDKPFFLYYPMSHIHGPILRTPDSKKGADKDQLYADNVEYMDKLVGKLMDELERQNLREKTSRAIHRRQRHGPLRRRKSDRQRQEHQRPEGNHARRRQPRAVGRELARPHAGRQSEQRPHRLQRFLRDVRRTRRREAARRREDRQPQLRPADQRQKR